MFNLVGVINHKNQRTHGNFAMNKTSNGSLFLEKTNRPNARFPSNHRKRAQQVDFRLQSTY